MRSRTAFWWLFAGLGGGVVLAAAAHDVWIAVAGPLVAVAGVLRWAYRYAQRRGELEFFTALAPALGLRYMGEDGVFGVTPLLAAGDRRRFFHVMQGDGCKLGLYTYEIRRKNRNDQTVRWEPYHFTICELDLAPSMPSYPGVYVRRHQGLIHGDDWLRDSRFERVQVESIAFSERYDVLTAPDQDPIALRQLLTPALIDWMASNPLSPGFELRAGVLVVWLPGHVEETGKLELFVDSARHIAETAAREAASKAPLSQLT